MYGSSGTDILLYCYHFGLALEMVKGTQQPSVPYVSIIFMAFFCADTLILSREARSSLKGSLKLMGDFYLLLPVL